MMADLGICTVFYYCTVVNIFSVLKLSHKKESLLHSTLARSAVMETSWNFLGAGLILGQVLFYLYLELSYLLDSGER